MFIFVFSAEAPAFQVLPSLKRLKQRIIAASRGQYDAVFMSGRYGDRKCFWTSISNSEFCIISARFVPEMLFLSLFTQLSLSLCLFSIVIIYIFLSLNNTTCPPYTQTEIKLNPLPRLIWWTKIFVPKAIAYISCNEVDKDFCPQQEISFEIEFSILLISFF